MLPADTVQFLINSAHEVCRDREIEETSRATRHIMSVFLSQWESPRHDIDQSLVDWSEIADRFLRRHVIDYCPSESTEEGEQEAAFADDLRDIQDLL